MGAGGGNTNFARDFGRERMNKRNRKVFPPGGKGFPPGAYTHAKSSPAKLEFTYFYTSVC